MDLRTSMQHCGACGRACGPDETCTNSRCQCAEPLVLCAVGCVDVRSDARNCGTCGRVCGTGLVCSNGLCALP
jgi:hypothetical protein